MFISSIGKSLEAANGTVAVITFDYLQMNGSCGKTVGVNSPTFNLVRRCFIMAGPNKSIPLELNGIFISSNLAQGR